MHFKPPKISKSGPLCQAALLRRIRKAEPLRGKAEPRCGKAEPRCGKAEPRCGKAEPRCGKAEPLRGKAGRLGGWKVAFLVIPAKEAVDK